jgi:hypothetical protein
MLPPDIVAKLNECAKTNFIDARDVWFYRQSIFSWAVILGLVLEGPELIYDMLSIIRINIRRFRYSIALLENRVELAKVLAFAGWIFIIIGLLGELRAGSKIADLSASIQGCSDAKVRAATLEAGEANERASANALEAEQLRQEAALLQESLAWRHLSTHDEKLLSTRLSDFKEEQVVILYNVGDGEGFSFAREIAVALHKADLNVFAPAGHVAMSPLGIPFNPATPALTAGIEVASAAASQSRKAADVLIETLRACGFDATHNPITFGGKDKRVSISVETRPKGPQGVAKLKLEATKKKTTQSNPLTH